MVGGINTLFGYSMFALFIFLDFHYAWASFVATVLGVLFNFKTTGVLVFRNKDNGLLFRFFCVYSVVYIGNVSMLKVLGGFGFDMYMAGAVVTVPLAVLSFVLNKLYVFGVKNETD